MVAKPGPRKMENIGLRGRKTTAIGDKREGGGKGEGETSSTIS